MNKKHFLGIISFILLSCISFSSCGSGFTPANNNGENNSNNSSNNNEENNENTTPEEEMTPEETNNNTEPVTPTEPTSNNPPATTETFTITWLNYDGTELEKDTAVAKGTNPHFDGETPTKAPADHYHYTFSGWNPTPVAVTADATYTATFNAEKDKYTITWKNDDGSTINTTEAEHGVLPTHDVPSKASTDSKTYAFQAWTPTIVEATENATYTATYTESTRKFTVTWKNDDGSTIDTEQLDYGATPSREGPAKAEDAAATYAFNGWSPEITSVTKDVTYTATYTSAPKKYTITWKNDDGTTITTEQLNYGATPSRSGPAKAEDANYTYTFKSWVPSIHTVTEDATYTASYDRTPKVSNTLPDTIYFTNNKGWSSVKAYLWKTGSSDQKSAWPGDSMTFFKTNELGQDVYKISGVSQYKYVIFNGSGGQTVNIPATGFTNGNNACYCLDSQDAGGNYKVGYWYESASATYNFATKGQNILHCFDWKLSTIKNNLDKIASQGFTAIQTSPLQPVKDFNDSKNDTHATWWRFYQPVGICLGDKNSNILFDTADGETELAELTEAAAKKGIRVIVDVIVNHLADGNGNGGLNSQVATYSPEIYNNYQSTLHNPNGKVSVNYSTIKGIVKSDAFGKDLKTSNSTVQNSVYDFLKDLVDCGVTGFRFDAAKHIETAYDGDGCGSSFWQNTLGKVSSYATKTLGRTIWSYGEIINPQDAGRSYYQYINDAWFYAVTAQPGWFDLPANNCVSWGESHDDYMGDSHATTNTSQADINSTYSYFAKANRDTNMLYFVRPVTTEKISAGGTGYRPDWGWQNGDVRTANGR